MFTQLTLVVLTEQIDFACMYSYVYKYLFWLCFNLTACNTYILEPEIRVKCPQDIFCLELGKGLISYFNSWKPPTSDFCLHVSRDPLTNISTKINGHERQCIIVKANKANKEIWEILWNSTQKYGCAHLRTLVSWELYLTRSVIESFCGHILETMTEQSWITAREATWWKGSNNRVSSSYFFLFFWAYSYFLLFLN